MMKVRELAAALVMADPNWEVLFEFEDITQPPIDQGCFDPDEIVFDFKNEVIVLRSID